MAEQKTYVPKCNAKEITFSNGNSIIKIGFHAETVSAFMKEHANEKGYVNFGVSRRQSEGKFGETHTVWLDTWKPKAQADDQIPM